MRTIPLLALVGVLSMVVAMQSSYIADLEDRSEAQAATIEDQKIRIAALEHKRDTLKAEVRQTRMRHARQLARAGQKTDKLNQRLVAAQSERRRIEHYLETKYRLPTQQAVTLAGYFYDAKERAEERYGVELDPSVLAALSHTESRFNLNAVSSAGAVGIMQVMPRYHVDRFEFLESRDDLFVPRLNIRAGVFVFAEAMRDYGSVRKAIRAYHGGRRGVHNPRPSTVAYEDAIFERLRSLQV